ncbi:unnamed protein product, partial [Ectocarpus sp. 12 AP-2014]
STADAASITLDGLTTPIAVNAQIQDAPKPIASGIGNAVASGLIWTGGEDLNASVTDRFIAWCFDLIHPVSLGATYDYEVVDAPFSNSYLLEGADVRVSSLFNANYDTLETTDPVQAAAFQLAVWEVANDNDFDLASGVFQASGYGIDAADITATAQSFLSGGVDYHGPENWQTFFLETRESKGTQNLVTAVRAPELTPVPLPASGLFLFAGL